VTFDLAVPTLTKSAKVDQPPAPRLMSKGRSTSHNWGPSSPSPERAISSQLPVPAFVVPAFVREGWFPAGPESNLWLSATAEAVPFPSLLGWGSRFGLETWSVWHSRLLWQRRRTGVSALHVFFDTTTWVHPSHL
jgi:hypothetical protein